MTISTEDQTTRAEQIQKVVQEWISPRNKELQEAVDCTVKDDLFTRKEILYQLQALKLAVTNENITNWFHSVRNRLHPSSRQLSKDRAVLAIHAGNIPLAGFQDLISIALSRASYYGKFSSRDPWLLPSLVRKLESEGLLNVLHADIHLPNELHRVTDVLFSGGTDSWELLSRELSERGMDADSSRVLRRTAQFSVALLDKAHPATMKELVEAISLHQGRGCRSVGMVLTEIPLDEIKCELGDYFESFWLEYPSRSNRKENLRVRAAYNRAMGRPFAWLDSILLEESEQMPVEAGIVQWRVAKPDMYPTILESIGGRLQSVFVPVPDIRVPGFESRTELLDAAQKPPIDWRPDGIDPLEWLLKPD